MTASRDNWQSACGYVFVIGIGGHRQLLGSAYLLGPRLAITCAHVVSGRQEVQLGFPWGERSAMVEVHDDRSDCAVLTLRGEPIPRSVTPLALADEIPQIDAKWQACGYPKALDIGVAERPVSWVPGGRLRTTNGQDPAGNLALQLQCDEQSSGISVQRLSGAPVAATTAAGDIRVIGHVRGEIPGPESDRSDGGTIYACPGEAIRRLIRAAPQPNKIPLTFDQGVPYPRNFAGRKAQLAALTMHLNDPAVRVVGLVAPGGFGKTSLARAWVETAVGGFETIYWFSFYKVESFDLFMERAVAELDPDGRTRELGNRALRLRWLLRSHRLLLVLDGLEVVQSEEDGPLHFGKLEDRVGAQMLTALCSSSHESKVLITSRFPVADLAEFSGREYRTVDVGLLSKEDARALLQTAGVQGTDGELDRTAAEFGFHALSLKFAASYLVKKLESKATAVELIPRLPERLANVWSIPEEKHLERVLATYSRLLERNELRLMETLSIYRRPVKLADLYVVDTARSWWLRRFRPATTPTTDFVKRVDRLERVGLLEVNGTGMDRQITSHPSVRMVFEARLEASSRQNLHQKAAGHLHSRLKGRPEREPDSLQDLQEVLALIGHLCSAGLYAEAASIYIERADFHIIGRKLGEIQAGTELVRRFLPALSSGESGATSQLTSIALKCLLVNHLGLYLHANGELTQASLLFRQAINLTKESGGKDSPCAFLINLADCLRLAGRAGEALSTIDSALRLAMEHGDQEENLFSLACRAAVLNLLGRVSEATAVFQAARAIEIELSHNNVQELYGHRGQLHAAHLIEQGAGTRAEQLSRSGLEICTKYHHRQDQPEWHRLLAACARMRGDNNAAIIEVSRAHELALRIGTPRDIATSQLELARITGELQHTRDAERIARHCEMRPLQIEALLLLAELEKSPERARTALAVAEDCRLPHYIAAARKLLS